MPKSKVHGFLRGIQSKSTYVILYRIAHEKSISHKDLKTEFSKGNETSSLARSLKTLRNFGLIISKEDGSKPGKPKTHIITEKGSDVFRKLEELRYVIDNK